MIVEKPYDRERAVEYARRWALSRNPLFIDFTGIGGNCTNFVSQAIYAGLCVMNYTPDFGWYYISSTDRAPAWAGVDYFYDYFTGNPEFTAANGGVGPYGVEVPREAVMPGDAIQLAREDGTFYHTVIAVGFAGNEILVAAQSDNALGRPLSSYTAAASMRYIHILGARIDLSENDCFENLINGVSL